MTVRPGTGGRGRGWRARWANRAFWLGKTVASDSSGVRPSWTQKRQPYLWSSMWLAARWDLEMKRSRKPMPLLR